MNPYLLRLARSAKLKSVPQWVLRLVERRIDILGMRTAKWAAMDPYANGPFKSEYKPAYPYRFGIIKEFWHQHWPYIEACREMKVAYQVIDLAKADWMERIINSKCQAFFVWPSVQPSIWKQMFDERLRILSQDMGMLTCPTLNEIWFHESKRRAEYWLKANNISHPQTWVFYNKDEALDFVHNAELPLIFKPDRGSSARGTRVFRNRQELVRYVNRYFRIGLLRPGDDWRDWQWGNLILQQFIEDAEEWRMIRIGSSYFGYKKGKVGDFHSGSKIVIFDDPPRDLLDFTEELTNIGRFSSMSLDILRTKDGTYLVNEFHPVFGRDPWDHSMEVNGKPGRYVRNESTGDWQFEEGIYTENSCCNLRVKMIIDRLIAEEKKTSKQTSFS
jgi:hypothetical protein